jgi:hypothetical protein
MLKSLLKHMLYVIWNCIVWNGTLLNYEILSIKESRCFYGYISLQ